MKHFVLISCATTKLPHAAPAELLYSSTIFRLSLAYARTLHPDAIYTLSAKHGLIYPDQHLEPYEQTLNKMTRSKRTAWGQLVLSHTEKVCTLSESHFSILAGLAQGERLQFLKRQTGETWMPSRRSSPDVPVKTNVGSGPRMPKGLHQPFQTRSRATHPPLGGPHVEQSLPTVVLNDKRGSTSV